jgi:hypothetical protein
VLLATGCSKFLDEKSQNLQYADNAQKLREVLMGDGYEPHFLTVPNSIGEQKKPQYFSWLNTMDDDITEYVTGPWYTDTKNDVFGFYTWQANPFVKYTYDPYEDDMWPKMYANINAVNIIAAKADELSDNPAELKRIKGEALFLRAGYYFYLVNVYAKAYNKTTAATDPGVPLKITEYVQDGFFARSSVDSVYRQIVSDLAAAETCLTGVTQPTIYYADINAVNLLQSRVFLYMQEWEKAMQAADKVITRKGDLYNLAGYTPKSSFFSASSPEAIFTQGGNAVIFLMVENQKKTFKPADELMGLYKNTDLRRNAFFELDPLGKYRYTKMYRSTVNNVNPTEIFSDNFFLRAAEAYLNKAEAAAMLNQPGVANDALNLLGKARFLPADYTAVNLADAALINYIRDERRREMCFEGHRWFDLKRYAVNPKYPFTKTIVHTYSDALTAGAPFVKATLTLQPNDPAYLIPIPAPAMLFNQGALVQNPERPDRKF